MGMINTSISQNYNYQPTFKSNYYSTSKNQKIAKGLASFCVPGLGQVINGETGKGAAFFLGNACAVLFFMGMKKNKLLAIISHFAIALLAANDAYKKG